MPRQRVRKKRRHGSPRSTTLYIEQILEWADAHFARTGQWPSQNSGMIHSTFENWRNIDANLLLGQRGLRPGSSLARLLAEQRGHRNIQALPSFTINGILRWADAHHRRTREWPTKDSGPIDGDPGETWAMVDAALRGGKRGLPGGSSLPRLLQEYRGVRNRKCLPEFDTEMILQWADAHFKRTGVWPQRNSGAIAESDGESWATVNTALCKKLRGIQKETSLAKLLASARGVRNLSTLPQLTFEVILQWADAHHQRTGGWPKYSSGAIAGTEGETWAAVEGALRKKSRGIRKKTTLAQLLAKYRGVRDIQDLPDLTLKQVLTWINAHHQRTGNWPTQYSGPVADALGETWCGINTSLHRGRRGLPHNSSLAKLVAEIRQVRHRDAIPPLCVEQIVAWAKAHRAKTGKWPTRHSGPIEGVPGETWMGVDKALYRGRRSLPPGSSLTRLAAAINLESNARS